MLSKRKRLASIALALLALGLALALRPIPTMAIEEPRYDLIEQDGDFSLRKYPAVIVAETQVDGSLDQASSTGFRRLAGYIFGDNHFPRANSAENLPGTDRETSAAKTTIAMTAPVTTQQQGAGWSVNFSMPAQYSLASLPLPNDSKVRLREIPELTAAVVRFSGRVDESKIAAKTALLQGWMAARKLNADGAARLARYNPPWTLPFLRRNEILIPCHYAQLSALKAMSAAP